MLIMNYLRFLIIFLKENDENALPGAPRFVDFRSEFLGHCLNSLHKAEWAGYDAASEKWNE